MILMAEQEQTKNLASHRIPTLPANFYYVPNFLSASESSTLLQKIPPNRWTQLSHRRLQAHPSTLTSTNTLISAPLPQWLTTYPPILDRFEKLGVFEGTKHGAPNHVLINEYKAGEGIMPHEDGPAYAAVVATVSLAGSIVLNLYEKATGRSHQNSMSKEDINGEDGKEERMVDYIERDEYGRPIPTWRILQEPGSLLVTTSEAYEALLHGISPITRDTDLGPDTIANWELLGGKERFTDGVNERETRISLTYRDVLKVSKISIGVLGKR